ncbi:MAG: glycosyltransferase family 4 protein [Acidobacteriota bacterium]
MTRDPAPPPRVLYAAYRHDPDDPDRASGADHRFANALRAAGFDVVVSGPLTGRAWVGERLVRRVHRRLGLRHYTKFPLSLARRASRQTRAALAQHRPDAVFTMFPPTVAYADLGDVPLIYRLDTCFRGWHAQRPTFSALGLALAVAVERRCFARATRVITHSDWTRDWLVRPAGRRASDGYGLDPARIDVLPNPSGLPEDIVPDAADLARDALRDAPSARGPRLLFVGSDPARKALDVAVATLAALRARGSVDARLTVCGLAVDDARAALRATGLSPDLWREGGPVALVGRFRKVVPAERARYAAHYRAADLLLHPAHFDPSPIVVSEAAAFGVPTVGRRVGGMATSVRDGETGVLVPIDAAADVFADAILDLWHRPAARAAMRQAARTRYERSLTWTTAGPRVADVVRTAIDDARCATLRA